MGNIFGNLKNIVSGPSKLSFLQVLILGLIPLGQLWGRIFYFNGSLDKWWLMFPFFLVPPFSFIPILMMKFGFVADGKGANPLDYWMLLPVIAKFIIPFILPFVIDEDSEMLTSIVSFVLQLLFIMTANLARRHMNCKEEGITLNSFGKAGIDSTIAYTVGDISSFVIPWLPFVGTVSSLLEMIPIVGDTIDSIFWSIGFIAAYVLLNMFNQDNLTKFCSTPFTGNLQDKIPFLAAIGALVGMKLFNAFSE